MFLNGNAINTQGQGFFKKLKKIMSNEWQQCSTHFMFSLSKEGWNFIFWHLFGTEKLFNES